MTIHSELLVRLSKPLSKFVKGDNREAKEGIAVLDDVDEQTFARFLQYAYTKDYLPAQPDIIEDGGQLNDNADDLQATVDQESGESLTELCVCNCHNIYRYGRATRINCCKCHQRPVSAQHKPSMTNIWDDFTSKSYPIQSTFQPRKNVHSTEDYTKIFLSHARLYVFGDKYDIPDLKLQALSKLHKTLTMFTLYDSRTSDIVELIRYTYQNTISGEDGCDMRQMVTHYAASKVKVLARDEGFRMLLVDEGEIGRDVVLKMTEGFG